ncbi:sigma-54-dependent Fis family transcriptional regulator [Sphingomonas lutea]|uniref:Sigma-54-dependent Fis family transcriptional regulator n=1 Tax=Sphingomonas lutea TaxID=1045317 RepID=A0A7G9SGU1_9SPHN|nr:sigma-54 dependent transcriptional regulator [Sphingomonas lutea]QNN67066.1 sigma-54-dependent Fis family transcriptional regulator [Sphingomonas lutea]
MDSKFNLAVVVDDDPDIALAARLALRDQFARIVSLQSPAELLKLLDQESPDAILLDLNFERGATDGREGLDYLNRIMAKDPDSAVVIITAHGAVSIAVDALKRGASDFVAKPWSNERLAATVRSAASLRRSRVDARVERGRASELAPSGETPLLGKTDAMQRVRTLIERAAPTDANVLILGENGTGKEIVAREIHRLSRRSAHPMVSIDLGATSESLFESELFGHVKGAFTGAAGERIGRLKAADKSTLFLDEIGNLPLHLQPKLLTALEQRQVVPVGANRPVAIDVRIVAATNASGDTLADETRFRQDLLFRLNTIEIHLPPLRERREDIPLLLDHYFGIYARKYDRPERQMPPTVRDILAKHDWPGNVRALRHAAERAVIMADGVNYRIEDFPLPSRPGASAVPIATESLNLDQLEKQMIERALRMHHFNISLAATELGLSRGALYRRMEKHGL